ncbi:hypothetical protein PPYR_00527 [Photinus pyralis]|uniref:Methyltransferase domain-containing protein n=1 Tax=Photinus pyralis TaxID=7054 RepID=A0A5N4B1T4_PHOPY|nr:juvenile hormone acid O-methyltransferase-like [Photinus pyralis]KAB0803557.1 hypothetical protein PPYR_00527 [Photinus pyralis]
MNNPELYDKTGKILDVHMECVIKDYLGHFSRNGTKQKLALDLGSGPGWFSYKYLYQMFSSDIKKMIGVDQSENMVKYANDHYGCEAITFRKFNFLTDQIPSDFQERFDYVFSFWALQYLSDYTYGFGRILQMMKSGGDALLVFPASCQFFDMYKVVWTSPKWSKFIEKDDIMDVPFQNCENREETLREYLCPLGFHTMVSEIREFSLYFCEETAKGCLWACLPVLDKIPKGLRSEFVEDHMKEWTPRRNADNEQIQYVIDYRLFVIYAKK